MGNDQTTGFSRSSREFLSTVEGRRSLSTTNLVDEVFANDPPGEEVSHCVPTKGAEDQDSPTDSVVQSVLDQYIQRSMVGKKKYGTTLDRDDLSIGEWIQHTQEELMDATLYLEKLKRTLIVKNIG